MMIRTPVVVTEHLVEQDFQRLTEEPVHTLPRGVWSIGDETLVLER